MKSARYAVATLLMLLAAVPLASQDGRTDLDRLRSELAAIETKVRALDQQARTATDQLAAINEELRLREEEVALAARVEEQLELEQRRLVDRLEELERDIETQKEYLSGRMVALYKLGRLGYLRMFLDGSTDPSSLGMLRFLIGRDARAIERFRATERLLDLESQSLARRRSETAEVAVILQGRREAVRVSRRKQQSLLARIEEERKREEEALAELRDKVRRLERLLEVLAEESSETSQGVSIREFSGVLPWPVEGRLLERFGRQRSRRFATYTINNGIRIEAAPGDPVRSLYAGTVLYAQWFRGYGNLIILDHGDRVFSLYGNTRGGTLEKGDLVRNGQVIALVSEDEEGDTGALYFEIRVDNEPVNPLIWLR